jgi:hypothetical protein
MTNKEAARRSGNYDTRQKTSTCKDAHIISDYNDMTHVAGIIITLVFGLMFFCGIVWGW